MEFGGFLKIWCYNVKLREKRNFNEISIECEFK